MRFVALLLVLKGCESPFHKCFTFQEEDPVESDNLTGSLPRPMPTIMHHSIMYAPKCLVLVSRQEYIETFRVSLESGVRRAPCQE